VTKKLFLDDVTKAVIWFYHSMNTCDWKDFCPRANGFALDFAVNGGSRKRERKGLVDVVLIEFLLQLPLLAAS